MSDDFYPFVDSGDPAPDNTHLTGRNEAAADGERGQERPEGRMTAYACRIAVYDDMLSAPRVVVVAPSDVRTFLEEITNTVYRCMKEQGGSISLQVIREICENFIHAGFQEPTISVLDGGNTIRFADQGPGIADKERAFEFGVTSADREQKRYIRGTGSGFPIVQDYLAHMGGAVSIEDNMGAGTVVTVTLDPARKAEIERAHARGAAVRPETSFWPQAPAAAAPAQAPAAAPAPAWPQAGAEPQSPEGVATGWGQPHPADGGMATGQPPLTGPAGAMYPAHAAPAPYPAQQWPAGAPWPQAAGAQGYGQGWQQPGWGSYPAAAQPAWQQPAGWQQAPQNAWQQPAPGAYPGMPPQVAPANGIPAGAPAYRATERGRAALAYIQQNGSCGPTDLTTALGSSNPTWSRELAALARSGLVIKQGQKYVLTDMGSMWLQGQ